MFTHRIDTEHKDCNGQIVYSDSVVRVYCCAIPEEYVMGFVGMGSNGWALKLIDSEVYSKGYKFRMDAHPIEVVETLGHNLIKPAIQLKWLRLRIIAILIKLFRAKQIVHWLSKHLD